MKKICVVTSTRADYGIMRPLIQRLNEAEDIELRIVATGMHLCREFGTTVREIEADAFPIHRRIEIQFSSDSSSGMSKTMGLALLSFSDYFRDFPPDLVLVLGDRYEIEAICCAAVNQRIPIAHICGGEVTTGAVDNSFRHAITKMASLHFPSTETYRRRIVQMGEAPDTVFNFGLLGLENIQAAVTPSLEELAAKIGAPLREAGYAVVTFHPVTLENHSEEAQMRQLTEALDRFPETFFLVTKANSDAGGRTINALWARYANDRANCTLVDSLGAKWYLSALKHAAMMIGNSSSGITEGPMSGIPTVNIGDRQAGRIMGESILCCPPETGAIEQAMRKAMQPGFRKRIAGLPNPYGDGRASERMLETIRDFLAHDKLKINKSFYDIQFPLDESPEVAT